MLLMVTISILVSVNGIESVDDYILVHPERQVAALNSTITLKCRVKVVEKYEVHWVKDGFGLGNSRTDIRQYGQRKPHQFRFDLPFNLAEGEYDLRITDLELFDEGVFYCQIVVNGKAYSSQKVLVQVLVPSDKPQLVQINKIGPQAIRNEKNPIIVNDGEYLHIKCIAKHGRPGASLYWYLNEIKIEAQKNGVLNETFLNGKITITSESSENLPKLYDVVNSLELKIVSLKNGNWLKCLAINNGYTNQKLNYTSAQIVVYTVPIVVINVYPKKQNNIFIENDIVEFTCSASGRPSDFHWAWTIGDESLVNIRDPKYKLKITRVDHGKKITCCATSKSIGCNSTNILVKYGPNFKDSDSLTIYAASIGENMQMECRADGNPEPLITWQRISSNEVIARGSILLRNDIQADDFGDYICKAAVKEFPERHKYIYLGEKGPPEIKNPSVSYGREGQSARLSCTIKSIPFPNDNEIKWIFKNKQLLEGTRHKMYRQINEKIVTSVLHILSVQPHDFGDYNCSVSTKYGSDMATIILLRKSETPMLMIVGATIIFLFILLVIIVVLCICQRRKFKDEYMKGNPSSPEIPLHHEAKSTLIDSDCQCNPNLYSWIPQSFDVKSQNDVLSKIHYQDGNFWPNSQEIESCYSNSVPDSQSSNKSVKITKHENANTNPILYNMHTIGTNTLNRYSTNMPFTNLPIPREKDPRFCDSSQCTQYLYQNLYNPVVEHNSQLNPTESTASPIYIVKKPANKKHQIQFQTDFYSPGKPIIKNKLNSGSANMEMYTDHQNTKLISDYASNI